MLTKLFIVMLTCSLTLTGCATPIATWSANPRDVQVENPFFSITVVPQMNKRGFFTMFRVEVFNKTDQFLEVDWNESNYLFKGEAVDQLVFSGIDPKDAKQKKITLEKIAPGQIIIKDVGPLRFASFITDDNKAGDSKVIFGPLPGGYNGLQLVVYTEDKAIVEQIQMYLSSK